MRGHVRLDLYVCVYGYRRNVLQSLRILVEMIVQFKFEKVNSESESRSVMSNSLHPLVLYSLWNSPGQNTGVGSHSLLQGIFATQESQWDLLPCRQILYQLSYQGMSIPRVIHQGMNLCNCFTTVSQVALFRLFNLSVPRFPYL